MVQRGDRPRFTLKPLARDLGAGQLPRQHLDRDLAFESRVARAIDLAHTAGADGGDDLVRAEPSASGQRHSEWLRLSASGGDSILVATILACAVVRHGHGRSAVCPRGLIARPGFGTRLPPPGRDVGHSHWRGHLVSPVHLRRRADLRDSSARLTVIGPFDRRSDDTRDTAPQETRATTRRCPASRSPNRQAPTLHLDRMGW